MTISKTFTAPAVAAALLFLGAGPASAIIGQSSTGDPMVSPATAMSDRQFAMEAAQGSMAEVAMSQLAVKRASNPEVRQLAQQILQDHMQANTELNQVTAAQGVTVPSDLDPMHAATVNRLSSLSGPEFDRAYLEALLLDHQKDIPKFRTETQQANDPLLRTFAARNLPVMEQHLQLAQATGQRAGLIVTPNISGLAARSARPETVEGEVLRIENDAYIVKDIAGREVRLLVDRNTKLDGNITPSDLIIARTSDGGITPPASTTRPIDPTLSPTDPSLSSAQQQEIVRQQELARQDRSRSGQYTMRADSIKKR